MYINSSLKSRPMVILEALLGVARKHNKKYCYVSQKRLEELVEQFGGILTSNRSLNRDLRLLEDDGWIERVRRHHRSAVDGHFVFATTLYKFKAKVFNCMVFLGNTVKRVFSSFRLPKWADNQLAQKRASSLATASSVGKLLIKERNGTLHLWDPRIGEFVDR